MAIISMYLLIRAGTYHLSSPVGYAKGFGGVRPMAMMFFSLSQSAAALQLDDGFFEPGNDFRPVIGPARLC